MMFENFTFPCCLHEKPRKLDWCESNCSKYYSCDTVAGAEDELKELENSQIKE